MMHAHVVVIASAALGAVLALTGTAQQPPTQQTPPAGTQQPSDVKVIIDGPPGLPPRIAVTDFLALTNDAETVAAAKTIGQVLWDDLNFEREFYMVGRDTYKTIPMHSSLDEIPLDQWKQLVDGLLVGSVRKTASGVTVQFRLINVNSGQSAMAKEYSGSPVSIQAAASRQYAHTIADEVHLQQRGLVGVARTKLAFTSDRDGDRVKGPVDLRGVSNLYIADYDGARQTRVTISRALDISPVWSPDTRSIAFSSWRTGYQDLYVIYPFGGPPIQNPTRGTADKQSYLPAWSPDGSRLAFTSSRDGNPEIYVMNRDGGGVQRITNHPAIDSTPTWAPTGTADRLHLGSVGKPADLRGQRRRDGDRADYAGVALRPADVVARPVQRDRVLVARRCRKQHPRVRLRDALDADDYRRHRQQREPGVRAERPAHRVRLEPCRQGTDLHDRARRQGSAPDHADRREPVSELVALVSRSAGPRACLER